MQVKNNVHLLAHPLNAQSPFPPQDVATSQDCNVPWLTACQIEPPFLLKVLQTSPWWPCRGETLGWEGKRRAAHKFICRDCLPSHKYRVNELFSSWNLHMHLNAAVCFTRGLGVTSGLSASHSYDLWHLKLRVTVTRPTFWGNQDEKMGCCEKNNFNFSTENSPKFIAFLTFTFTFLFFWEVRFLSVINKRSS